MVNGNVDAAGERFEHAFALGCQLGDPCCEGIAGRGLGCIARSTGLPDGYLWAKVYALEALCGLAASERMPEASIWIDELQGIAARCGMREFTVCALMHRATLGDSSSAEAARLLSSEVENPALNTLVRAHTNLHLQ